MVKLTFLLRLRKDLCIKRWENEPYIFCNRGLWLVVAAAFHTVENIVHKHSAQTHGCGTYLEL